ALPGATVDRVAQALLFLPDRLARAAADDAVDLADVVAARQQQALQFLPLLPRQAGVVGGPRGREPAAAAQAVGQVGNRQRVAFRCVVGVDGVEVLEHQE